MSENYLERSIESVSTIDPHVPDDFFIMCASFEERCKNSIGRLSEEYEASNFLILRFQTPDTRHYKDLQRNLDYIKNTLGKRIDQKRVQILACNREDPLDGYLQVRSILEKHGLNHARRVAIDISTFTKEYLLVLLNLFNPYEDRIKILYTSVKKYDKPLSWGVKSIVSVPFYNGYHLSRGDTCLILFVGYEGHRARAIWNSCEPTKTHVIVGITKEEETRKTLAEKENEWLLSMDKSLVTTEKVHTYGLNETSEAIRKVYHRFRERGYNICLSPISSKIPALATYVFCREEPKCNIHVIYARPFDYPSGYVRESAELYEYLLY